MKGMKLSSLDQQTTARCPACDTTDEELARSGWRANLWVDVGRAAERSDDGLKKTVVERMTEDGWRTDDGRRMTNGWRTEGGWQRTTEEDEPRRAMNGKTEVEDDGEAMYSVENCLSRITD